MGGTAGSNGATASSNIHRPRLNKQCKHTLVGEQSSVVHRYSTGSDASV